MGIRSWFQPRVDKSQAAEDTLTAFVCLPRGDGLSVRGLLEDLRSAWRRSPDDFHVEGDANVGVGKAEGFKLALIAIPAPVPPGELELAARAAWHWPDAAKAIAGHRAHLIVAAQSDTASLRDVALFQARALASIVVRVQASAVFLGDTKQLLEPARYRALVKQSAAQKRVPVLIHVGAFCIAGPKISTAYSVGLRKFGHDELEIASSSVPPGKLMEFLIATCDHLANGGAKIAPGETVGWKAGLGGTARKCRSQCLPKTEVLRVEVGGIGQR